MFSAVIRAFRTPDLRRKLLFTLFIIGIFRMGSFIPAPFVNYGNVQQCLQATQSTSGLYELVNLFSGGALLQLSVFALGIMPYITASIITQLLRVVSANSVHPLPNHCPWNSAVNHFDCRCTSGRVVWRKLHQPDSYRHFTDRNHPDGSNHDRRNRFDHVDG